MLDGIPLGLSDPVSWRNSEWIINRSAIINGRMKWKVKTRVRVALLTEKAPQICSTRWVPMEGMCRSSERPQFDLMV